MFKKLIIIFILLSAFFHFAQLNSNSANSKCLKTILNKYINDHRINIVIQFNGTDHLPPFYAPYFLTNFSQFQMLLEQLELQKIALNSFTFLQPQAVNIEDSLSIIELSGISYISATFLIILDNPQEASSIAKILSQHKIYHALIIAIETYNLFRVSPANIKNNFLIQIKRICTRDIRAIMNEIRKYSTIYPDDTVMKIIWSEAPPFINRDINSTMPGIYFDTMKSFRNASPLKFQILPNNPVYLKELIDCYDFTSISEAFSNNTADIYMGAAEILSYSMFDVGPIVSNNNLYFLIPLLLRTTYLNLLLSWYTQNTWICGFSFIIAISVVFTPITWYTIDRDSYKSWNSNFFMFFAFTITSCVNIKNPSSTVTRLIIGSALLSGILSSTFAQAKLTSLLFGSPYLPPIKNLQQLIASNIPIKIYSLVLWLYDDDSDPAVRALKREYIEVKSNASMFEIDENCMETKSFATTCQDGFLIMQPHLTKTHNVFKIALLFQVFLMPKNHYLSIYFFGIYQRIIESGITEKYIRLYKFRYAWISKNRTSSSIETIQLGLEVFSGLLPLYFAGITLAVVALLLEIVVFNGQKKWMKYKNRNQMKN